eukprot:1822220-Prorocentrum_lima.AAC.1
MYATLRWQGTLEEALDTPNVLELIGEIPPAVETYPDPDPQVRPVAQRAWRERPPKDIPRHGRGCRG